MSSLSENPILIDEEQDKEKSPPPTHPKTLVSERPTQPPVLMRSQLFGTKIENAPDYVCINLFENFISLLLCMYLNIHYT